MCSPNFDMLNIKISNRSNLGLSLVLSEKHIHFKNTFSEIILLTSLTVYEKSSKKFLYSKEDGKMP